ncbi:MAG: alpha/beta fold hydrolase [Planctomycetota bacterium]|nr:MAG: alpha/beta fold hydrolase [Planctomycetota bacterium]REJ92650.1 MAG: alpha/beta fold hydrolase [Planctomycetota bacterium]REK26781.1 MAG: alpha/beta fold hydrolase [Planctomycetota bacterium]REK34749.1 MAG: alpha/beta fold hydrolase [Planctomycetota bacterium]
MSADRPEMTSEYPFESRFLEIDGLRYHYLDEGSETSGPLLFVHGNPTWSFAWRNLIKEFAGERRSIAVDHIGCGYSEKPQNYGYRLADHVTNLVTLIEALDLRDITLVAHDWGGCIGMGAAGRLPDRFSRFVLMNTAAFRSTRIPFRIAACRWPVLGALGVRGLNLFARAATRMAVASRLPEAVKRGFLAPYDSWENRIAIHRFVQDIPLRPSHPSYKTLVEIEESLAQFQNHPMLLIWGMRDWCFTPTFLDEWIERFPQAAVRRLGDASHYVFEDAPREVAAGMREFLSGDCAGAMDAGGNE